MGEDRLDSDDGRRRRLVGAVVVLTVVLAVGVLIGLRIAGAAGRGRPVPAVTRMDQVPGPTVTVTWIPLTSRGNG